MTPSTSVTKVVIIAGVSASGKSVLAIDIARRYGNCVILNADSQQVYAGLPILTAAPSEHAQKEVPHRLYGMVDGGERFSVAKWLAAIWREITSARQQGTTPIVVGGTGLYLQALLNGLAFVPDIPATIKSKSAEMAANLSAAEFYQQVKAVDHNAAQLAIGDNARLRRLWEVATHTGRSLKDWQNDPPQYTPLLADSTLKTEMHCLYPPRAEIYARADARFAEMLESGAVNEVSQHIARGLDPELPSMKIIGVREIASMLSGEISREEAIRRAQQATRNYIKRQFTWFKNTAPWREL